MEEEAKPAVSGLENIVKNTTREASDFMSLGKKLWKKDKNYPAAMQQKL